MKVLLVEDDIPSSRFMVDLITVLGHEVKAAGDGIQGLAAWKEFHPDLIISDIRMPNMDGLEFLAKIREADDDVVVVMVTAYGCEEYTMKALRLRANDYIKKPVRQTDLQTLFKKYAGIVEARAVQREILGLVVTRHFRMQFPNRIDLVHKVADYLIQETGSYVPKKERLGLHLALTELLTNAIEHGNLGITYEEKASALDNGFDRLESLYQDRLQDPVRSKRKVTVDFTLREGFLEWRIEDEGQGFDWKAVPDALAEENLLSMHGRGILLSRIQFDEFEFLGPGNAVRGKKLLASFPTAATRAPASAEAAASG
jgi:YesN/AraC family two-component response regulator